MGGPKIQCNICNDIIQSMSRHDFVRCSCGAIAIDGGDDYIKICGDMLNITFLEEELEDDE